MTKRFREFFVDELQFPGGPIEGVQKWLSELVQTYGENINVYIGGDDSDCLTIYEYREETDEEHEASLKHVESYERAQYERLKAKFGDK